MKTFVIAVAAAAATYFLILGIVLVPVLASGDGLSCDRNCSKFSDALNDAAPWPMLGAILLSLAIGLTVARRRK